MTTTAEKIAKTYTKNGGRNANAFPWAAIIQALLAAFGGCIAPAAAKRWARRNPEAAKEIIDETLKHNSTFSAAKDRNAAKEAAYTTFLGMSDSEIRAA